MGRRSTDHPRIARSVSLTSLEYKRCSDAAKVSRLTFSQWATTVLNARAEAILSAPDGSKAHVIDTGDSQTMSIDDAFLNLEDASDKLRRAVEAHNNRMSIAYRRADAISKMVAQGRQMSPDVAKTTMAIDYRNDTVLSDSDSIAYANRQSGSGSESIAYGNRQNGSDSDSIAYANRQSGSGSDSIAHGNRQSGSGSDSIAYGNSPPDRSPRSGSTSTAYGNRAESSPNPNHELMVRLLSTPVSGEGDEE